MAIVQSLNENHFKTFRDLAEAVKKQIIGLLVEPIIGVVTFSEHYTWVFILYIIHTFI